MINHGASCAEDFRVHSSSPQPGAWVSAENLLAQGAAAASDPSAGDRGGWPSTLLLGGELFMNHEGDDHPESDVAPARVAAELWRDDAASQALGMELEEVRVGYARLAMPVRDDMVNGHGVCHGGFIFTLAESAFSYASNASNHLTLGSAGAIDFLAPARLGELLHAEAQEHWHSGRNGLTDVTVTGAGGRRIAVFRGRGTRVGGSIVHD